LWGLGGVQKKKLGGGGGGRAQNKKCPPSCGRPTAGAQKKSHGVGQKKPTQLLPNPHWGVWVDLNECAGGDTRVGKTTRNHIPPPPGGKSNKRVFTLGVFKTLPKTSQARCRGFWGFFLGQLCF